MASANGDDTVTVSPGGHWAGDRDSRQVPQPEARVGTATWRQGPQARWPNRKESPSDMWREASKALTMQQVRSTAEGAEPGRAARGQDWGPCSP